MGKQDKSIDRKLYTTWQRNKGGERKRQGETNHLKLAEAKREDEGPVTTTQNRHEGANDRQGRAVKIKEAKQK